jgi:hypothetical protein
MAPFFIFAYNFFIDYICSIPPAWIEPGDGSTKEAPEVQAY